MWSDRLKEAILEFITTFKAIRDSIDEYCRLEVASCEQCIFYSKQNDKCVLVDIDEAYKLLDKAYDVVKKEVRGDE